MPSTATLEIRLLGEATVRADGVALDVLASPRLLELLARLTLQAGTPVDRSTLAFSLWPDSSDAQARTNLRHLLHDLRRGLPDADRHLDITSAKITWRSDSPADVDVVEFLRARDRGDLDAAVGRYGGELLPGHYTDDVLAERQRLADRAADALRRLATAAAERGDHDTVIECGRGLLDIDPMSEPAHQLLMQAHAARGERATALRLYHTLVDLLAGELGVEPSAATRAIYASLSRSEPDGDVATPSAPAPVAPSVGRSAATLVGREPEFATITGSWDDAAAGRAQLLLITGEAGVGKSRLLDELAHHATAAHARVARTRAYETAGRDAWGPVVDWLRTDAVAPSISRLEPAEGDELARFLIPELPGGSTTPRTSELDPALQRRRLLEAATAAFTHAGPTLLAVDDLQWCDPDSLDLIGFALRRQPDVPLMIAATMRDDEVEPTSPAATLIDALHRDALITTVALDRLDLEATAALLRQLARDPIDDTTIERLHAETQGNPLFVVEAVRAGLDGAAGGSMPLTATVQAVIRSRLHRLGAKTQDLVEIVAVLGT